MILQINLIPEARLLKLQAMSRKRLALTVAIIVGIIVTTIISTLLLLMGYVFTVSRSQQSKVDTLNKDINSQAELEQSAANLQENLNGFYLLQNSRLYVSEIFKNLGNVIPADVSVSSFQISPDYLVTISGTANSYASVSSFSVALQEYNLNFKPQPNLDRKALFSSPTITSISKSDTGGSGNVNFSMTFKVDPTLFSKPTVN
ncbi:MAG: PilN domain-containing protein [Candidatus Saccharibacteria bacterium]